MGSPLERVIALIGSLAGVAALVWAIYTHKPPQEPPQPPPVQPPKVVEKIIEQAPSKPPEFEPQVASAYSEAPVASATPAPQVHVSEPPPEVKPQIEAPYKAHAVAVDPPPKPVLSAVSLELLSVARFGDRDDVERLLRQGADPNAASDDGKTPLILAAENGHHDACEALIEALADPTRTDNRGRNALHYAAERGHNDLVQYLLNHRTPAAVFDYENNTPEKLARLGRHNTCVKVIQKAVGVPQ